ncbi:MAG: SufS family cysteine desulfurase [Anaerolineales bacterium]|nr:SufS family cysteine desulfurase [Anaerolineales bacterium]
MRSGTETAVLDVESIRAMFPVLARETRPGVPLIYLDSAATSQKPNQVIAASSSYYEQQNANIHRGIHQLAEEATEAYEGARKQVAAFIGAPSWREVIFTRNTTEAINLVANAWGRANLKPGDLILLTEMEHHSNLVPWQILAAVLDLRLAFVPVTPDGLLDMDDYRDLLTESPRLVGFVHMSNMLGTINPVAEMTAMAHEAGALVLVDGAQSVPHFSVDVSKLDVDFFAFSAHKMCGPTGIGVLYGRERLLDAMPPFLGGGDMIKRVRLDSFEANELPWKFEAGTPAIAQGVGFGAAVEFLRSVGMEAVHMHEQRLTAHALDRLEEVPGVTVYGPGIEHRGGVVSFTFDGVHPHDVAQILDVDGIAVRAGHHCAMPLHEKLCIPASTRASFYLYNTIQEIDKLIEGLYKVKAVFG